MDYVAKLNTILVIIEDLMEDANFIDQLTGEDEGFLNTVWDYFDRIEAEMNPSDVGGDDTDPVLWREQQDAETD